MAAYARDVLARLGVAPSRTRLVFTGHPIPTAMAAACDYEAELLEASTLVAERGPPHDLALESRSRPPAS